MKKVIAIAAIALFVWSCTKKMTPAQGETNTPNTGSINGAPSQPNTEMKAATTTTAATAATQSPIATQGGDMGTKTAPAATGHDAMLIAGQATHNAKCGRCHGLKVTTDYTAERWVSIMQVMATKARLDETEKANVLAYVQANSKK